MLRPCSCTLIFLENLSSPSILPFWVLHHPPSLLLPVLGLLLVRLFRVKRDECFQVHQVRHCGWWSCWQDLHAHLLYQQQVPYCNLLSLVLYFFFFLVVFGELLMEVSGDGVHLFHFSWFQNLIFFKVWVSVSDAVCDARLRSSWGMLLKEGELALDDVPFISFV